MLLSEKRTFSTAHRIDDIHAKDSQVDESLFTPFGVASEEPFRKNTASR